MAFSEKLAERIRTAFSERSDINEMKMFGGVGFLLNGNMLVGVWHESLIVRLGAEEGEAAFSEPHVKAFDITGRPMKGWFLVGPEAIETDEQLQDWIERAVGFVETLPSK